MTLRNLQAAASIALVVLSAIQPGYAQQATPAPSPANQQPVPPANQPASPQANQQPATQQPATQPPVTAPNGNPISAPVQGAVQQVGTSTQGVNPTATNSAQQQQVQNDTTGTPGLPQAPGPKLTEPLYLRDTPTDYTKSRSLIFSKFSFAGPYTAIPYELPRLGNSPQLDNLLKDGKIYLSLSDAVLLAIQNNYDIAIARINLDIADTDILRTESGALFRGVSTGLITGTLGGTTSTVTGGGGPGGTSSAAGGAGTGANGLVLSTNGGGPQPYNFDPVLTGTVSYERVVTQGQSIFQPTATSNILTEDAGYIEGFSTGTNLSVTFNNNRTLTTNPISTYSPLLNTVLRAQVTQHLLQGFGTGINRRFIVEAKNDRRITDSSFRQQVIYTVTQVENIYWGLVSAYEDEQSKERALAQSTQLTADNRKQLEIGTLAPLDVVNSDSSVANDKQALIASKSNLEFQQLIMKQAIARNLNDPALANAPVIPSDRVGLDRLPEEDMQVEDLVRLAFVNNPQIEQAVISLKNNEITIRGEKNGLLPIIDAFGFYGTSALGGNINPNLNTSALGGGTGAVSTIAGGYGGALQNVFTGTYPDYGVGVQVNIPLRNRLAQADQARSQMEYRQTQIRLQQLYTQTRINVINGQYALTNDRSQVAAAQSARDFAAQSLDAEQKKYKLGASTTALVLQQQRNLATADNNLITATAIYAKDRVALRQLLSTTLDLYSISLTEAASGNVTQAPVVPGLTAPKAPAAVKPISATP